MSITTNKPPRPLPVTQETAVDNDDPVFTNAQFEQLEQHFLRRLAAASDCEEINGMSTLPELKSYFVVQYSMEDYSE